MPDLVCDKCGRYYRKDKSVNKYNKCSCGGKLRMLDAENLKKSSELGKEPKRLENLTSKNYIPIIMIFMMVLVGIVVFSAASSVFDPAGFYDVKCPYCSSENVKMIDSDISNQSLSISNSFDVYLCEKCKKEFYYDKESEETIKY
ncbi:MAG: hypothetical protein QMD61_00905 [Methanobacterium sp.]|nr:hypothetical protein [Methanobacterium sp.]